MMDVLADVLAVTRLGAAVIAQAELVPPWGLEIDPALEAAVHVVQRGQAFMRVAGERTPVHLHAGDVVLIRGGVAHGICDSPTTAPLPYTEALAVMPARLAAQTPARKRDNTVVLCAKYLFQHVGPHPLISLLPPFIHLPAHDAERHGQLQLLLQLLRHEALDGGSGSELVVPRLVDSLLVFVLRAWLVAQPVGAGGWFGALRDPAVAKALALMHEAPSTSWTVQGLAQRVAQSRATFARRFAELVGEPPMAYLARWRMCLAAKMLSESELSLEEIAPKVGYETAAAFSKAFRRSHGTAPGRFRKSVRESRSTYAAAP